ncbi:hypothetical protein [Actinoplanes sichuanensis]|uniref:DUF4352 domain-containing protein n=1 Tax=Actinoplanes sichuanensis TaxID=512349 RepID=A0ABW4A764_9ACTN|nr:hypothetical protein [Actinoplanes sichuanensis]
MTPPRLSPLARRVAVGAGVLAVAGIAAAVVFEVVGADRSAVPPFVVAQTPESELVITTVKIMRGLGASQTLTGADGTRVEIAARLDPDRPPLDIGPERTLFFTVRLKNTGPVRASAELAPGTRLLDGSGGSYPADLSRSVPIDPTLADDWQLEPGDQADLALVVPVRTDTKPFLLSIVHPMGGTPRAEWVFPS